MPNVDPNRIGIILTFHPDTEDVSENVKTIDFGVFDVPDAERLLGWLSKYEVRYETENGEHIYSHTNTRIFFKNGQMYFEVMMMESDPFTLANDDEEDAFSVPTPDF